MHLPPLLLLATASLIHATTFPPLLRRQTQTLPCSSQGLKDCGDGCIDLTDTCCPDRAGGCPTGTYCSLGSNGDYGCCRNGRTCSGPGGAITTPGDTITSTRTVVVPQSTEREIISTSTSTRTRTSTSITTEAEDETTLLSDPAVTSALEADSSTMRLSTTRLSTSSTSRDLATMITSTTSRAPEVTANSDGSVRGVGSVGWLALALPFFII